MKPIDYRNQQSQLDICPSDKCLRRWNNQWNAESFSADDDYGSKEGYNDLMVDLERSIVEDNPPCPTCGGWTKEHHHMKEGGGLEPYFVCYNCREREEYGAESFNADSVSEPIYLLQDHASGMRCLGTESFLRAEMLDTYYYSLYDGQDKDFPEDYDSKPIEEILKEIDESGEYYELMKFDFPAYGYWFEPYEKDGYIIIDDFSAKLDANRAKLGTQKVMMVQGWLKEDKGAESFAAESRDELIDTLIGIRQELAREEGMEDWENESEGPLDSLSSAFIQELIWYVDGDRDTWNAESFNAADTFAPAELVFGEDAVVVDDDTGYRCPFEVEEFSDEGLFTYTICNHPLELVYHVADGITSDEPFYTYECSECHEGFQAVYTVCTRNGEKISEDWEVGENLYGWAAEEESYNAEHDSYPMNVMIDECGCGEHEITDDDYDTCETCGTIWEFPDCTSGVCGICFKVCEKCNPKKRKKHYQTCTLEG